MSFDHWLAFTLASAVLCVIPGPTVLLVISYALGHGKKSAVATIAGVALGDLTAMTASLLGLGALLATSAGLFAVIKWIGAAYLIFMGIKLWRAPVIGVSTDGAFEEQETKSLRILLHAYIVTALNPKGIIFFVAFLPQFLDLTRPLLPQMVIFEMTFLVVATINVSSYALLANLARRTIRKPSVQQIINRTGGSLLIAAGLISVGWRRAT